jgi:hypothetical protein
VLRVAVAGASGYMGAEALRLLLRGGFPDDATLPDEITDYGRFISAWNRSIEREPTDLATAGTAIEEL